MEISLPMDLVSSSLQSKLSSKELSILHYLHQEGHLEKIARHPAFSDEKLLEILRLFSATDTFYEPIGGLAGYREKIAFLLGRPSNGSSSCVYHAPTWIDVTEETPDVLQAIDWGIEALPLMAEMIPLGGAADRLHLVDAKTGAELPAAKLVFGGKTLLERIIADIQARESLYFERFGVQIVTPIALMTSLEKENHFHIEQLLMERNWFGRPKESYRLFTQPLVPVVDAEGSWVFADDLRPIMKPGGHGAIWKLASDLGVLSWFESLGKKKLLVRQINNPLAGLDYGILTLIGWGARHQKKFGFASAPRLVGSAEGVNVLIERDGKEIVLTNIEYCDFARFGIEDLPMEKGGLYSRFSSNTNLLFADLQAIREAVKKMPFPGLLLNLKKGSFVNCSGQRHEAVFGRLESTMQNIADVFVEEKTESLIPQHTFITYNKRHKTISTTKKGYVEGGGVQETPEACFYDLLFAARELLEKYCGFVLPPLFSVEEMLEQGPEFVWLYHPGLGPLYLDIAQKIQGGSLSFGSLVELEIGDFFARNLHVEGSLRIAADALLGEKNQKGHLLYGSHRGRCSFRNVKVRNAGVDWTESRPFWKGAFQKKESVEILLHGSGSLYMEDVTLSGSHFFEVFDNEKVTITERLNKLHIQRERIE